MSHDKHHHELELKSANRPYYCGRLALDGLTLNLKKEATAECLRCGNKGRGWAYVSSCDDHCYHVICVMDIIKDNWRQGFITGESDPFQTIQKQFVADMDKREQQVTGPKKEKSKKKAEIVELKNEISKTKAEIVELKNEKSKKKTSIVGLFVQMLSIASNAIPGLMIDGSWVAKPPLVKREASNAIPGLMIDGSWVAKPPLVKREATDLGVFEGIRLPNGGPTLSHLFYADDALIIGRWSKDNLKMTSRLLRIFYLCSGLKINLHKSHLFGMGVNGEVIHSLGRVIGCKIGDFPFEYLGIKTQMLGRKAKWFFKCKPGNGESIRFWKDRWLGDTILLERCPKLYELEKDKNCSIAHRVVQIGSVLSLGSEWNAWPVTVEQISELQDLHKTSRCKILPVKRSLTGCWKTLVSAIDQTQMLGRKAQWFFKCKPGNGESIRFWKDRWLGDTILLERCPKLYELEKDKNCSIAHRVVQIGSVLSLGSEWNAWPVTVEQISELQDLQYMLSNFSFAGNKDSWRWDTEGNRSFDVVTAKKHLRESRTSQQRVCLVKWEAWVPLKINILMWRIELDRLPTRMALQRRQILIPSSTCPLCDVEDEDCSHIFVKCGFAFGVWSNILRWCNIRLVLINDMEDLFKLHKQVTGPKWAKKIIRGIVMVTCWAMWNVRNKKVFDNTTPKVVDVVALVKSLSFLWLKHRSSFNNIVWKDWAMFPLYML
ncbi:RNA-directed DNA polymerase, eukaryota, Reverse transcriptase zinc-binding domain protein [Artemisia annua]|uniref:RNA-directed DNA polymerase, eukaryota, Reverse transcriptase zinc-binding domain protein n=1 Tax=Artemisia annua TaxID=35608 RepID=A0A2U1Q424_ARTAN|nr:RNA-directed DNA polymerase, eukaryota, Reverse transcriptase zinc-binding domain protein [Artemisia annua]